MRLDEEELKEKLNVEETKKSTAAEVAQTQLAMGNVAAVASGSQQRTGIGQQSAATAVAPGAVLVPTAPGSILHSNDMSTEDIVKHFLQDPTLAGMTPEMAAAVAVSQMRLCQARSTAVAAGPADAEPATGGTAEEDQKQLGQADMEAEDPMTSDEEENETREANRKGDEYQARARIRRSAKEAKRARSSNVAGALGVKTTIGNKAT